MARSKKTNEVAAPSPVSDIERNRYRAEDDFRTLKRAEEIRADRERFGMAKQEAKRELKATEKIVKSTRTKRA